MFLVNLVCASGDFDYFYLKFFMLFKLLALRNYPAVACSVFEACMHAVYGGVSEQ